MPTDRQKLNRQVFDLYVKDRIELSKFIRANQKKFRQALIGGNDDLSLATLNLFENVLNTSKFSIERNKALKNYEKRIIELRSKLFDNIESDLTSELSELSDEEQNEAYLALFLLFGGDDSDKPLKDQTDKQKEKSTKDILLYGTFAGLTLKEWFKNQKQADVSRIVSYVTDQVSQQSTDLQVVKGLTGTKSNNYKDGVVNTSVNGMNRLVATTVAGVANSATTKATETLAKKNDVQLYERYSAILDSKTCFQCAELDGKIFKLGEGAFPPMHSNCRCTRIPILGKDVSNLPEEFDEWFADQSEDYQKEYLGNARFNVYKNKNTIDVFTNPTGEILTIKELKRKV